MQQYEDLLRLHTPATYCLRLNGALDQSWSERLGGMTIATVKVEGGGHVTTLTGRVLDQAALLGILNSVYNLGLPLLSVECLDAG